MNPNKIAEVRKLIDQSQSSGKRPHYSDAIKALVKSLLKGGVTKSEIMNATGISIGTLVNWSKENRKQKFRKLKATAAPSTGERRMRVSLPSGISIEVTDVSLLKIILEQVAL